MLGGSLVCNVDKPSRNLFHFLYLTIFTVLIKVNYEQANLLLVAILVKMWHFRFRVIHGFGKYSYNAFPIRQTLSVANI